MSDLVPVNQEWLTLTGVTPTGTCAGTRLEMRELLQLHTSRSLEIDHRVAGLFQVNEALALLEAGRVTGRIVVDIRESGSPSS